MPELPDIAGCGPVSELLLYFLGLSTTALTFACWQLWTGYQQARREHLEDLQGAIAYTRTLEQQR